MKRLLVSLLSIGLYHPQARAQEGLPAGELLTLIRESEKMNDPAWTYELSYEAWDPHLSPEATKSWMMLKIPKDSYSRLQRNTALDGGHLL